MKRLNVLVGLCLGLCGVLLTGCHQAPQTPPAQKPLMVVELTASDCGSCQQIHQIVDGLRWRYKDWVGFITLDMTNRGDRTDAIATARNYNASEFVTHYQDRPGTVGLLDSQTGLSLEVLQQDTDPTHYETAMQAGFKALNLEPPKQ